MGVDAWGFDAERQVAARRLRSKRLVLRAIHGAVISVLATALVAGGAASLRDSVLRLGWPGWASAGAFLSLLFGAFAAAELPFAYVGGFRWERAFGLSRQRLGGWLLWLLAATHWWWLVAWILGVVASLGIGFLAPIVLVPLFYRLRPIQDVSLRNRFASLAARAGVPVMGAFVLEASAKTRRSNAAVMGFGRTRRIVVTDTLLAEFSVEEIDAVLAHELAHQRHLDPLWGLLQGSLASLAILAVTAWLYDATRASFGIPSAGDMAGLPWLAVLFSLVALPLGPLQLRWSRERESWADRFALDLTRNPAAFAAAMVRLHDRNLGVADPRRWEKWLFYSHPTGRERVESARAFAAARA